jgi:hypothetical protein
MQLALPVVFPRVSTTSLKVRDYNADVKIHSLPSDYNPFSSESNTLAGNI